MLSIMTSKPIVTMIRRVNPNQPSTMAVVPTPLLTLPLPRSRATILAATEAVCCHSTDTSTKIDAMKMMARADCDTAREGNGLTSLSEPRSSDSSCHPGKVASKMRQMKAKMTAMMLLHALVSSTNDIAQSTHMRYGKTIMSLNWLASHSKFRGSSSTETSFASAVALLLHNQSPPSGLIQIPKYPTRAAKRVSPTMLAMAVWTLKST